jgi:diguanylate cyclase (GGDEF)-like protein
MNEDLTSPVPTFPFSGAEGGSLPTSLSTLLEKGVVLLVDDNPLVRKEMEEVLKTRGYFTTFYHAEDGIQGLKLFLEKQDELDIVFCDVEMPNMNGFELLKHIADKAWERNIPIVMVTARDSREERVLGLSLGASDYVAKPIEVEELYLRALHQLRIRRLYKTLKGMVDLLNRLSITDPLTHLYNRRYFYEVLKKEFGRAVRYQTPLALLLGDIDHFKRINDRYGHQAGDQVLKEVGKILSYNLRSSDSAFRYGGEEFALILPGTDLQGACYAGERYRHEISRHTVSFEGETISLTISFGVVSYPEIPAENEEEFVRKADLALYRAKEEGRNRVVSAEAPSKSG